MHAICINYIRSCVLLRLVVNIGRVKNKKWPISLFFSLFILCKCSLLYCFNIIMVWITTLRLNKFSISYFSLCLFHSLSKKISNFFSLSLFNFALAQEISKWVLVAAKMKGILCWFFYFHSFSVTSVAPTFEPHLFGSLISDNSHLFHGIWLRL